MVLNDETRRPRSLFSSGAFVGGRDFPLELTGIGPLVTTAIG